MHRNIDVCIIKISAHLNLWGKKHAVKKLLSNQSIARLYQRGDDHWNETQTRINTSHLSMISRSVEVSSPPSTLYADAGCCSRLLAVGVRARRTGLDRIFERSLWLGRSQSPLPSFFTRRGVVRPLPLPRENQPPSYLGRPR